ncbi:MAG: hypothetical protein ABIH51_01020 [Patescibacteria group bacterium]
MEHQKIAKNTFTLWGFSALGAIASYLFYFAMTRLLSIEDYGLLYSLISLSYFFTIPNEAIKIICSRYAAKFHNDLGKIKTFLGKSTKVVLLGSIGLYVIFLALTPILMHLVKADFSHLAVLGTNLIAVPLIAIVLGILAGLERFKALGINESTDYLLQLIFALVLVGVGFGIYGALIAIPLSFFLAFAIGFIPLRDILKAKKQKIELESGSGRYFTATFVFIGLITLMYSIGIILARSFFDAKTAGLFAGLALIINLLFFLTNSAKQVIFPILVKKKEAGAKGSEGEIKEVIKNTSIFMGLLFAAALILSVISPEQIIYIIIGGKFLEVAPLLKIMILGMAFFSFGNLLGIYNLSLNRNKKMIVKIMASAAFIQIALFILFHNTLEQFTNMWLISSLAMFVAMAIISFRRKV